MSKELSSFPDTYDTLTEAVDSYVRIRAQWADVREFTLSNGEILVCESARAWSIQPTRMFATVAEMRDWMLNAERELCDNPPH